MRASARAKRALRDYRTGRAKSANLALVYMICDSRLTHNGTAAGSCLYQDTHSPWPEGYVSWEYPKKPCGKMGKP